MAAVTLVLALTLVLIAAKLGGRLAVRAGQPAVLGELLAGVMLGSSSLAGVTALDGIASHDALPVLAELGVVVLLFEVGLESTVAQMLKVGMASLAVATLGVVAPFALGWGVSAWLLPAHSSYVHAFLGAALTATSVGITARVLEELGRTDSTEARIILGAAVIDDVMGLIVLAVVTGSIAAANRGETMMLGSILLVLVKAVVFLVGAIVVGRRASRAAFAATANIGSRVLPAAVALGLCGALSWLAHAVGLAPIVGAFAAGLVIEQPIGEHSLRRELRPLSRLLVPIFFVWMGMQTDLRAFAEPAVVGLAAALTLAAVLGKQACYFGVRDAQIDRLSVALGMIPRGEVGLIFANIGLTLSVGGEPIVSAQTYAAVVVMVIATTLLTPPLLKWSLSRAGVAK